MPPWIRKSATRGCAIALLALLGTQALAGTDPSQASKSRVEAALQNVLTLERPDQDGYATVWDGDKYVQCGRTPEHALRCESAGARLQPTLAVLLVPERIKHLADLGWRLDPSFGNYVQTFAPDTPVSQVADSLLRALSEGYDANLADLEVRSDWIASEPCPPRNGPSQNLAGSINDAAAMAATAIHACAFTPDPRFEAAPAALSSVNLINLYGPRVTGEIQRLRINADREVFFVLTTDAGYVQCQPETTPKALYCEAASAEEWPVVSSVLTPERLARLHAAGFTDPGRAPNYWKNYPTDSVDDAAIARELLTILHDVYGYSGSPRLEITTEKGK